MRDSAAGSHINYVPETPTSSVIRRPVQSQSRGKVSLKYICCENCLWLL